MDDVGDRLGKGITMKFCQAKFRNLFAVLMFVAGMFFVDSAMAQSDGSIAPLLSEASFSPSFGLTYTSMEIGEASNQTVSSSPRVGFSGGLSIYIPSASPYVDYQTGLYYSRSQTHFDIRQVDGNIIRLMDQDIIVQRLSVPLFMKLYPFEKSSGLYFNAGVVGNFLLSAKSEGSATSIDATTQTVVATQSMDEDLIDDFTPFVLDGLLGIGYAQMIGGGFGFGIELNYRYGLNKLIKDTDSRADTFYVTFGLGF